MTTTTKTDKASGIAQQAASKSSTLNVRVVTTTPLPNPINIRTEISVSERATQAVLRARRDIARVIAGLDPRRLVVIGPCSVHDPDAAIDYALKLKKLSEPLSDRLLVVMRVYFEKPRTTVGWKGLINDPALDGSDDIPAGLRAARRLLLEVSEIGLPAATEFLDPIVPQYISDLIAWAAIGARTTESQTHREMASGLSMPVGFKNGTDGSLSAAINAMLAAAQPHSFLGVNDTGQVAVVRTQGNPEGHVVLRGGTSGPNYKREHIEEAGRQLAKAKVNQRVLVDCAHGNSGKSVEQQAVVAFELADQIAAGNDNVLGLMIESNIKAGRQDITGSKADLVYGQSVTDPCIDFDTTVRVLERLAASVPKAAAHIA
ncbi:MAG TPA: 3-deoxy-7-phosphoheptulonate synthase [Polyangiaceae bacterium]